MLILGIDEAGRGPVIGPLVIAGVMIKEQDLEKLNRLGIKDSKLLSPLQRDHLFDTIKDLDYTKYHIIMTQPNDIDKAVISKTTNLNWLEAEHSIAIINKLKPDKVILDCPSNNVRAYSDFVKNRLKCKCQIIAEHKADLKYPIVGAASILAKVTRDREIQSIERKYRISIGSGYPSDPMTIKFLKENYKKKEFADIFRKSWESYKRLGKKQKSLWDFKK